MAMHMRSGNVMKQAIVGIICVAAFFVPALLLAQTVTSGMNVSLRVIIVPTAPINLTATSTSFSRIDLQWEDTSSNETGFKIERKTGIGGTYSEIDSVGIGQTAYASTELMGGTTYYYRVRAFNNDGPSGYSNEASSTTPGEPPVPPPPSNGSVGGVGSPSITDYNEESHEDQKDNEDGEDITVRISGHAYPKTTIRILVDGEDGASTESKDDASFTAFVRAKPGVHTFFVYAVDSNGRRSPVSTFSLSLQSGTVASASDIFIAPILSADKSEVKQGDVLTVTGQSAPSSTITLVVSEGATGITPYLVPVCVALAVVLVGYTIKKRWRRKHK